MKIVYHVGGRSFEDLEEAIPDAQKDGLTSINWSKFDQKDKVIAEGGYCINSNCNCHKRWTYWQK